MAIKDQGRERMSKIQMVVEGKDKQKTKMEILKELEGLEVIS
jgi:hypothetical protein